MRIPETIQEVVQPWWVVHLEEDDHEQDLEVIYQLVEEGEKVADQAQDDNDE